MEENILKEKQRQYFQVADLIFSHPENQPLQLSQEELNSIQEKFQTLLDVFATNATHYATNFIKMGNSRLPYTTATVIGKIGEYSILNFTTSYSEPLLFVVDTNSGTYRNYIDVDVAKNILNEALYENVKEKFLQPKILDRVFKNIPNMNLFVEKYRKILTSYNNPDCVTGRECFEIKL